jgi:hypothetical protein
MSGELLSGAGCIPRGFNTKIQPLFRIEVFHPNTKDRGRTKRKDAS